MWWGTAIEAPDPGALAVFYARLLGWEVVQMAEDQAIVTPPQPGVYMVFQRAEDWTAPVWPPVPGAQRPMMHLDFEVGDLEEAVGEAISFGATLAEDQPQERVRVMFDPAGHPFCLCLDGD
ncbi:VOC family protein [Nakamurella sp. YIM 132087]|uniref:VOC family protein n=2 Tax=Nakamurella alba TaxID=2665158 RepID=A0A7K1FR25_9ACTN|nr:VOC family protein [Nakamurella alba]